MSWSAVLRWPSRLSVRRLPGVLLSVRRALRPGRRVLPTRRIRVLVGRLLWLAIGLLGRRLLRSGALVLGRPLRLSVRLLARVLWLVLVRPNLLGPWLSWAWLLGAPHRLARLLWLRTLLLLGALWGRDRLLPLLLRAWLLSAWLLKARLLRWWC
ncbi:hypothetical protein [Kribbella sp. NPDC055071]